MGLWMGKLEECMHIESMNPLYRYNVDKVFLQCQGLDDFLRNVQ